MSFAAPVKPQVIATLSSVWCLLAHHLLLKVSAWFLRHTASWNNRLWSPEHPDQPSALTSNLFRLAGKKQLAKLHFIDGRNPKHQGLTSC